jgi:hypothetical protein
MLSEGRVGSESGSGLLVLISMISAVEADRATA